MSNILGSKKIIQMGNILKNYMQTILNGKRHIKVL